VNVPPRISTIPDGDIVSEVLVVITGFSFCMATISRSCAGRRSVYASDNSKISQERIFGANTFIVSVVFAEK
jgi:hypothetical protein